jgi:hypothetical protein
MCDYSQHGLQSRLACEGELLITYRFPTELIGLASALDVDEEERRRTEAERGRTWFSVLRRGRPRETNARQVPAVCIPPGARLRMTHIPVELRHRWALRSVEDVWFTETGDDPERFRDAIRLANGRLLVLQTLPERICFMVLSLGSDQGITEPRTQAWPVDFSSIRTLPLL